ncbi:HNH endonuclease [Empedobacter brevis]|uniref:HNH endonuclease n=1 Tax=Empedobacter brevis TaxID=247 RepID=UPI00123D4746|nr:HNH endonuclease signature motif containing protein [Empedobacter brevis]QES93730.1 HNH endonuclease [Empedobacter brevis]
MDIETKELLIRIYRWSSEQIDLALRAKCKCEYCDKDMFESADNYKLWEVDHIIPKSSQIEGFDYNSFDNLAIACKQCNSSFKSKYNPVESIGSNKSREEYIQDIRSYIQEFRSDKEEELLEIKQLFSEYL